MKNLIAIIMVGLFGLSINAAPMADDVGHEYSESTIIVVQDYNTAESICLETIEVVDVNDSIFLIEYESTIDNLTIFRCAPNIHYQHNCLEMIEKSSNIYTSHINKYPRVVTSNYNFKTSFELEYWINNYLIC